MLATAEETGQLKHLVENIKKLSEADQLRLKQLLQQKQRGCRTNKWMDMVRPNLHPKQKLFLSLEHREVMFGGAAGGSKSDSLLLSMMQYLDVPGYSSIIFRRTFKDLSGPGSIMDRAKSWFNPLKDHGVRWSANDNSFYFPTGPKSEPSRYAFAYLQHDDDKRNYQGWELHACCSVDTNVIMADGSLVAVGRLKVGDIVSTPEGPRPVTFVDEPRKSKCVTMEIRNASGRLLGSQINSVDHCFLGVSEWLSCDSPGPLESKISQDCHKLFEQDCETLYVRQEMNPVQFDRSWRHCEHFRSNLDLSHSLGSGVSLEEGRNDYGAFGDSLPALTQPAMSFGLLRLFEPSLRLVVREPLSHASGCGHFDSLTQGSRFDCPSLFHSCDEPLRMSQSFGQGELTSQDDVDMPNLLSSPLGGLGTFRECNQIPSERCIHQESMDTGYSGREDFDVSLLDAESERRSICDLRQVSRRHPRYFGHQEHSKQHRPSDSVPHPYVLRMLELSERNSLGSYAISGFGESVVRDIRIAGSSCYITEMGICNRNCAFDELTQHPRSSYSYLFSRLRRKKGSNIPIRMRSATNPGGKFGDWVKDDFIPQEYLDLADNPDAQFARMWEKRTPCDECRSSGLIEGAECIYCEGMAYRTRMFVPSRIQDNPSIDMAEYRRSLINLPFVERYRLENGDWSISEQGDLFKESWARYYSRRGDHFVLHRPDLPDLLCEIGSLIFFLSVDTASKEKTTNDFTCISSWAFHPKSNSLILLHVLMERMEVPKIADAITNQSAAARSQFVIIESAQCGIGVIQELKGPKGKGMSIIDYVPHSHSGDKVARSTTAQVRMEAGGLYFPSGHPGWLSAPFAQLLGFNESPHDDMVDTVSMAAWWCHSRHQGNLTSAPIELKRLGR